MMPDRLPDPEQVREGNIGIDNCYVENLPEDYLDVVDDVTPLRRRGNRSEED